MATIPTPLDPTPTADEMLLAATSNEKLKSILAGKGSEPIAIQVAKSTPEVPAVVIPASAAKLLGEILAEMAQGNSVAVIPVHGELTTQELADLLNISRPSAIELLQRGEIPHRKVGTHRRILYQHAVAYQAKLQQQSREAFDALTSQAQELDLGY